MPTDQPLFAQDMIERWMSNSLYPGNDLVEVVDLVQDQLDECEPLVNSHVQMDEVLNL